MNVSIIICTKNRAGSLQETLASLSRIAVPSGLRPEVLIVDNGSTDGTASVASNHANSRIPLRRIVEPRPGVARAKNTGLRVSVGDIIVFTDDDVRVPVNWLERMCDPFIQTHGDVVAGHVRLAPHLNRNWMSDWHRTFCASSEQLSPDRLHEVKGANLAIARKALDVVPAFDTELGPGALGFCEENLFVDQLRRAGGKVCVANGDPVIHHFDEERLLRKNWLQAAQKMGRSFAYIHHHWQHQDTTRPHVRYGRVLATYYLCRALKRRECSATEGMPLWELILLERLYRLRHYIALRGSPRNYDKQGLIKRRANESSA